MSARRTALLGVAVWCAVVACGATLVWVVIARAGAGVAPEVTPQAAVTGSLPVPQPHASRRAHTQPGVVLTPRPSSASTSTPATSPQTSPTTSPSTTASSAPPAPPQAPAAQRRSWSGTAGHVVSECRGPSARLVSAYPNAGFRYQILARGPVEVRVRFLRLGDDNGITVTARCVAAVPHFSTTGHEPGDD